MEYLGACGAVVNSPNVDRRMAALAINLKFLFLYGKH